MDQLLLVGQIKSSPNPFVACVGVYQYAMHVCLPTTTESVVN